MDLPGADITMTAQEKAFQNTILMSPGGKFNGDVIIKIVDLSFPDY